MIYSIDSESPKFEAIMEMVESGLITLRQALRVLDEDYDMRRRSSKYYKHCNVYSVRTSSPLDNIDWDEKLEPFKYPLEIENE